MGASEDILSEVMRSVRLTGVIFFDVEASAPWVAEAPPAAMVAPLVIENAQHVMEYHVITDGDCWATLAEGGEPQHLEAGSVVMFPQGDHHVLSSSPGMRARLDLLAFTPPRDRPPPYYLNQNGGGPQTARMLCGFIGCDLLPYNPLIQSLPAMIHIPHVYGAEGSWLREMIEAIRRETRERRIGSAGVLAKLSELIFVEVVRRYMETLPDEARGWLAALQDRHVGETIRLLHAHPGRPWTLETLAREVGVSRTVLVERFTGLVGMAPIAYLARWRMQIAARMLREEGEAIGRVASAIGYESEAAFSRSFKRCTGQSPGAWRRQGRGAAALSAERY